MAEYSPPAEGGTVVDGGVVVNCPNIWCGCDYTELPRLVRFAHNPPLLFRGCGKRRGMARCRHTGGYPSPNVVIPRARGIQFCVPQNLRNNAE